MYHLGLRSGTPWQFYLYVVATLILTVSASALQQWLFKKKQEMTQDEPVELAAHIEAMEQEFKQ